MAKTARSGTRTSQRTSADRTGQKQRGRPFEPGKSPNPAGRPKGSRNKLGESFLQAMFDDFQAHGVAAIERVRIERPHEYLKVVASLLPKQVQINEGPFDGVSDDELAAIVEAVRTAIADQSDVDEYDPLDIPGGSTVN